jgi:hypothetical protein
VARTPSSRQGELRSPISRAQRGWAGEGTRPCAIEVAPNPGVPPNARFWRSGVARFSRVLREGGEFSRQVTMTLSRIVQYEFNLSYR